MYSTRRDSRRAMGNDFIAKPVSHTTKTTSTILVLNHATLVCVKIVLKFPPNCLPVLTVSRFVVMTNVSSTIKSPASFRGRMFHQNATSHSDVQRVQQLVREHDKTNIAVVNMYVTFVKSMCCPTICVPCNPDS